MSDTTDKLIFQEGTEVICIKKLLESRGLPNRCGCEKCKREREEGENGQITG